MKSLLDRRPFAYCLVNKRQLKSRKKLVPCTCSFLTLSRDESLVSRDENLVSREGGNLLLSGTVREAIQLVLSCVYYSTNHRLVYKDRGVQEFPLRHAEKKGSKLS